ncbi:ABC transporter ATP-binding protein [Finegoldia dalianensis]|uniref:ABC transporter ATP-binding protein n=1 Tax=Finegoldia dalianensis TaxID=3145239 RepID=A0ABW9KBW7_9FIRM
MNKYIFREKINLLMQILLTILLSCFLVVAIVFTKRLFEVQNKTFSLIVISASLILFAGINYLKDRTIYNMGLSFVEGFKQDLFHNVISQNFYEIDQKEKTFSNDITSTSLYLKEYYIIPTLELISDVILLIVVMLTVGFCVSFVPVSIITVGVLIFSLINVRIDKSIIEKKTNTSNLRKKYVYFLDDMLNSKKVINSKANKALEVVHSKLIEDISEKVMDLDKEELTKYNLKLLFIGLYFIISLIYIIKSPEIKTGEIIILISSIMLLYHMIKKIVKERSMIVQSEDKVFEMEEIFGNQEKSDKIIDHIKDIEFRDVKLYSSNVKVKINYTFYTDKKYLIICDNEEVVNLLAKSFIQTLSPQSGMILVNNEPIEEFDLSSNMLVTYDESYIFDTDFRNNVTLFNSFADKKIPPLLSIFDEELTSKQRYSEYSDRDKNLIRYKRIINQDSEFNMVVNLFENLDENTGNILLEDFILRFNGSIYCAKDVNPFIKEKFDEVLYVKNIDSDYLLVQE